MIAFPTVSRVPNNDLIDYVRSLHEPEGISCELMRYSNMSRPPPAVRSLP